MSEFDSVCRVRPRSIIEVSPFEDEYYMDDNGDLQVYPEKRDCQAYIESFRDTLFDKLLDTMLDLPPEVAVNPSDDYVQERYYAKNDLETLLNADQIVDEVKEAYPELAKATRAQVYAFLKEKANKTYEEYVAAKMQQEGAKNEEAQTSEKEGE